jgi:hypothetical protein
MDDIDTRRERAARNQSLFREVNERIVELSHRFGDVGRANAYLCECLNTGCTATIEVPYAEYERPRARGNRFFVLPGHEDLAVEDVVETGPGYVVVEKIGVATEIAEAADPRKAGSAA